MHTVNNLAVLVLYQHHSSVYDLTEVLAGILGEGEEYKIESNETHWWTKKNPDQKHIIGNFKGMHRVYVFDRTDIGHLNSLVHVCTLHGRESGHKTVGHS